MIFGISLFEAESESQQKQKNNDNISKTRTVTEQQQKQYQKIAKDNIRWKCENVIDNDCLKILDLCKKIFSFVNT